MAGETVEAGRARGASAVAVCGACGRCRAWSCARLGMRRRQRRAKLGGTHARDAHPRRGASGILCMQEPHSPCMQCHVRPASIHAHTLEHAFVHTRVRILGRRRTGIASSGVALWRAPERRVQLRARRCCRRWRGQAGGATGGLAGWRAGGLAGWRAGGVAGGLASGRRRRAWVALSLSLLL